MAAAVSLSPAPSAPQRSVESVGVVVIHYRFWPGLRATLNALLGQTRAPHPVIVFDNSCDGSAELIREEYPDIEVIESEENRGFAGAFNEGFERLAARGADAV